MVPPGAQRHGMSAAAQEALAEPIGLRGPAVVAASGLRECCRSGGDVVCACCQWSSGHPRQATLVRHFMRGVLASGARGVDAVTLRGSQRSSALTPALGPRGMPHAATARALVATGGFAPGEVVRLAPAGAVAIPVATIAVAAQDDLDAASSAQEQSSWTVQRHHQTEPVVLDGVVPARHTAVAPPSSARCRARRGHQAARRERAAAAPTFFGSGRVVLRRRNAHHSANRDDLAAAVSLQNCPVALQGDRADPLSSIRCSARNSASSCRMDTQNKIRVLAIT